MNEILPKISVIVPVYKVEPYLRQCVDSILSQTYVNLEIILVDDGSPDNCGDICDEYSKKDNRVIVIHKENGGLSDARNVGIEISTGECLTFIDSDDWVEIDMIELLHNNLTKHNADISICGFYNAYVNKNIPRYENRDLFLLNSEQAVCECFISGKITTVACIKLYKKHIFNSVRYPIGKRYEDYFVIIDVLSEADKIVVDTVAKYYYRMRKGSIMHEAFNSKNMDVIEAVEYNWKRIEEIYPDIISIGKVSMLMIYLGLLQKMVFCKNYKQMPEYKKVLLMLRDNYKLIMDSESVTKNIKIKVVAVMINTSLYKFLQSINDWIKKITTEKNITMFE